MNRPRVVLDTNVYVSGIVFGGIPAEILAQATEGIFILCVSDAIAEELAGVLQEKFSRTQKQIQQSCEPLWEVAEHITPATTLTIVTDDPDDNRILECAAAADADIIVSGDEHILRLADLVRQPPLSKLRFLTPRQFLGELEAPSI